VCYQSPTKVQIINWKTVAISAVAVVAVIAGTLHSFELASKASGNPKALPTVNCPPCPSCPSPEEEGDSWDTKTRTRKRTPTSPIPNLHDERILIFVKTTPILNHIHIRG
jgi:hypothetical protein